MAGSTSFKKKLNLLDLTFLGVGSIVGSGWLFAAQGAAVYAGPSAWLAWVIAAVAFILLGLTYAELGGMLPRAGGFVRYPNYTHGSLTGYLTGFAAMLAYSSVAGVEVEAVRGYASRWLPALATSSGGPSVWGYILEIALLVVFFLLNYWSVNVFGKVNSIVTAIKFIVPLLTLIVLLFSFHGGNYSIGGASPGGFKGVMQAVAVSGIAFAFLGWRQAVDFGSEAKNPQRHIPLAIILAISVSALLYIALQLVFIGAVPPDVLAKSGGWAHLKFSEAPYAELATSLGMLWLANVLFIDAVISPSGTGNIYVSGTTRVLFAWAKTGLFYSLFGKVDRRTGIPRGALWLSVILAIVWVLPENYSVWGGLVGAVTGATVLTYVCGPISAASLRRTSPDIHRPFRLAGLSVIAPLAFIAGSFIIYWGGWNNNSILIGMTLASLVLYFAFMDRDASWHQKLKSEWRAGIWLVVYYVFMMVMSYIGSFGPMKQPIIPYGWDLLVVAIGALLIYYWAVASALPQPVIDSDDEEDLAVKAANV
ncbi:MAG: APC family permease [Alicyclobacillus herbarius]|uniref:APC family permease n=1 Tax=Alicyclobacillus herbarius TaxID=122960 RepID=UPI0023539D44|nr:APC family permease [Alicyclobacillus herbarius]MCL6632396.1 APC family permease [Alicyclobacillus herbarius]